MPPLLSSYLRILLSRKPRVTAGAVPLIEASLTGLTIDRHRLQAYRSVCGEDPSASGVPIAFPHIMATPLQIALVASEAFPLNLLGVVHIRNEIVQTRPVREDETGDLHVSVCGDAETPRGQELRLKTGFSVRGETIWAQTSTLLARRNPHQTGRSAAAAAAGTGRSARENLQSRRFPVEPVTVRRYARVSGDFNPIHLADPLARLFGFKRAIAHGMWSLARCTALLEPARFAAPCRLDVIFKAPVPLSSEVVLNSWTAGGDVGFELRDARGVRGHLLGILSSV